MSGALNVEARCVEVVRHRPPRSELRLHLHLGNLADTPRWVLVPDDVTTRTEATGAVATLELQPVGDGPLPVVHGTGPSGFFGLLLAAGTEVDLEQVPVAVWGQLPEAVELHVTTAAGLAVEGTELAGRFDLRPFRGTQGPVDASSLTDQRGVVDVLEAPLDGRLEPELREPRVTSVTVRLPE